MQKLISISGKAGHGKDTVANVLVNEYGFKKISFADPLKEMCSDVFKLPLNTFHDTRIKDAPFSEPIVLENIHIVLISEYISAKIGSNTAENLYYGIVSHVGTKFESPRQMLQYIGTEVCRSIDNEVWVKITEKEINKHQRVVIADARYPNERSMVKANGGSTVLVARPSKYSKDSHISENMLGNPEDYDVVVTNDDSRQQLERDVGMWISAKLKT